jgi:hypothetical protein
MDTMCVWSDFYPGFSGPTYLHTYIPTYLHTYIHDFPLLVLLSLHFLGLRIYISRGHHVGPSNLEANHTSTVNIVMTGYVGRSTTESVHRWLVHTVITWST